MRILFFICLVFLQGCVSNSAFRTEKGVPCIGHAIGCGEEYEHHADYDLGFVEFTERGNEFDPAQTDRLINKIYKTAKLQKLAVVVFIQGWKHNASTNDGNVDSFNKALRHIAESKVVGDKRLIGVYVGWRGLSFHGLKLENLTFWDRKATAEEVGRGGVTHLLLKLESEVSRDPNNFMLTVGHSFGGAIALSALHDVMLDKMLKAQNGGELKPFGDGVVLLNPAIEANQGLLLKENSMKIGASGNPVPSLLYVISSRADKPTNIAFPLGQFLGVNLTWNQITINRDYSNLRPSTGPVILGDKSQWRYSLKEQDLDDTTIGNYEMFTTGTMFDWAVDKSQSPAPPQVASLDQASKLLMVVKPLVALPTSKLGGWGVESYCNADRQPPDKNRFPCFAADPIDFISVPKTFIADHNDVFNNNVISFLSAVVTKSLSERHAEIPAGCAGGQRFLFGDCFAYYMKINEAIKD